MTAMPTRISVLADELSRIRLFNSLPPAERAALAERFVPRRFKKGDTIIRIDDVGDSIFLIRSGRVKVTRPHESGAETLLCILGKGDCFGEMALLDGKPRSAYIHALEDVEAVALARDEFFRFLQAYPTAHVEILRALAGRIRRLNSQLEESFFVDLPLRLARALLELALQHGRTTPAGLEIGSWITQSELAAMVGASRQRVNRLLREWQTSNLIQQPRRGRLVIPSPEALEAAAAEGLAYDPD